MKRVLKIACIVMLMLFAVTGVLLKSGITHASSERTIVITESINPEKTVTPTPLQSGDEGGSDKDEGDRSPAKEGENDFIRIFGSGTIDEGEKVNDAVLIFSDGVIKGEVRGDCVVIGGKARLTDSAIVKKDLVSIFSALSTGRRTIVRGNRVNIGSYESTGVPDFVKTLFSCWDLMLALLLLLIFWRFVIRMTDRFLLNPAACLVTGFFGLIGFIPLIVLLAISIVGILLIPLIPALYFFSFVAGFAVTGTILGNTISDKSGKEFSQPLKSILGLLAALIILKVMALFPLIGPLSAEVMKMIIRTAGLGLLIVMLWDAVKKKKAA
ncbi:MAG: hypothetical protein RDV48_20530 [Candidatus Eremiobacteraeota bacterium]|nr:hypothetical protein [Candidatus Eremiobacteraeota bacterium]